MTRNLENFPTSESANRMLDTVTAGWYDNSYIGKWLFQVMGIEHDKVNQIVQELPYQAHVSTATWALRYWEELYGLTVREDLSYQERRDRINSRTKRGSSVNPEWLKIYVESLSGRTVEIREDNPNYSFEVIVQPGEPNPLLNPLMLIKNIDIVKPAHLSYKFVMCYRDKIELLQSSAERYVTHKRAVTVLEDPMLSMLYMEKGFVTIRPTAEEVSETLGLKTYSYEEYVLCDGDGGILLQ